MYNSLIVTMRILEMKDHTKLLTPELKAKVEAKIRECFKVASEKYGTTFEMPEVRYDIKSHTGGLAYYTRWLLRFNLILLVENEEHYIENVVPHEVAHLVNHRVNVPAPGKKRLMPHGKEWKGVMNVLGVPAAVHHKYDCSSIEKKSRNRRQRAEIDRIQKIMAQIMRLTEEARIILKSEINII